MHYISSAKLYMRRQSTYNLGMKPDAARIPLSGTQQTACGTMANWYEFSTCMGASPDPYVAGARAHEGYGTTGHNGHFSAAYDAVANPDNDPMAFFDKRTGGKDIDLGTFIQNVRNEFYPRAKRADDATLDVQNGGRIVTGNYSGPYWGWYPSTGQFVLAQAEI